MYKKYWTKYRLMFCTAVLFVCFEAFASLFIPMLLGNAIDEGLSGQPSMMYVLGVCGIMMLVVLLGAIMASFRNIISSKVSFNFAKDLRNDLYRKIQYMHVSDIDKISQGSLITRITNDITQLQNFVNSLMRISVKAPVMCIGALIMAIIISPSLSWVFAVIIPTVAALIVFNITSGYPRFKRVQLSIDRINTVMREFLSGIRVVKAFNRMRYEQDRFRKANEELSKNSISAMRVMAVFSPIVGISINFGIVFVLFVGGNMVFGGDLKVGQIASFVTYLTQMFIYVQMVMNVFNMMIRAFSSHDRIKEVISATDTESVPKDDSIETGRVEMKNLSFSYHNSTLSVLKNISFVCEQGKTLGVIGSTGAGKTTIANLLLGFYEPQQGEIYVGGKNVRDIGKETLRKVIAYVPQEIRLFSGTIIENIRWGKKDATDEECIQAARIAHAHDFISGFTDGYDTLLGQNGVNLSGGQKQRISIARAIIKSPKILLLDDSTSAVDFATERAIRTALCEYSSDLTCIHIAQRIQSIAGADSIIVLDKGEICGAGTHEELLKDCKVYSEIYYSQVGDVNG